MAAKPGHEAAVWAASSQGWPRSADSAGQVIGVSWKRCLDEYGLHPARVDLDVLSRAELAEHRAQIGEVINVARPEMDNLAAQIAGSGYALLLTDADGVILCHQAEHSLEKGFRRAGLWDGADWSEHRQGTNGIGTALIERRPVTVHCADHFATRNIALSCSAAPIQNPEGRVLGALDASSVQCEDTRASQMHTMALVKMSARLIEKCVFLNAYRDCLVLRFHSRPEFVNLVHDGMLAVGETGHIVAADASAAIQLGYDERSMLVGREIGEFFDVTYAGLALGAASDNQAVWPLHELRRGRRYFACARLQAREGRVRQRRGQMVVTAATPASGHPDFAQLAGGDVVMAENIRCARRVVDKGVQVLIYGETGTGKEAFARALHGASARAAQPFVAVNCAAIPEALIESELFGYKAGAFTGARREGMRGKILQASGGTLFLDEIGDMPLALQTRLLRVLEEHEVVPLGGEDAVAVELNLISATHAPLQTLLAEGRFREDLYYRLNGIALTLPPMRDRSDVETLLRQIIATQQDDRGPNVAIEQAATRALLAYAWPGNIRQLRNVIRTALALCDDNVIRLADLPAEITGQARAETASAPAAAAAPDPLASAERDALLHALDDNGWNITHTAKQLRMSRNTLYRKMKRQSIAHAGPR